MHQTNTATETLPHHRLPERSEQYKMLALNIARRQAVGGAGLVAANDNQAWPLAQQLRKEGNDALLVVAERYRAIYDAAVTLPTLVGTDLDSADMFSLDQRVHVKDDGSVQNKGMRKRRVASVGADPDKKPVTFPISNIKESAKKWKGDVALIAAIDSRKDLQRLRGCLGPLLEPFENAVLHGETLTAIGVDKGAGEKTSGAAGRVIVMMGLEVVQRVLGQMDTESKAATPE